METITLGKTGLQVTPLGVGTWAWGDKFFWTYGQDYGLEQIKAAYDASIAAGITLFDTAEVYGLGESERILGKLIKSSPAGSLAIATKYMPLPCRVSAKAVKKALSASLERLQLKKIDLYQIHQPVSFLMSQKTLIDAIADEVKQGKITAVGVSNYSAEQMREAHAYFASRGIPLAVNQVQYSLMARKIETNGILDTAKELGVTILAYSPLAQGLLSGKYTITNPPTGARKLDSRFGADGLAKLTPLLKLLQQIATQYDRTPAQVALNWLIAQGNVIPIPGAKTGEQATQNAGALGWKLDPVDVGQLSRTSAAWKK
ncbi:aldo/keto reductase [Tumidithrix helvetica PCC 7403]|uniref:aldo/keto reductase n=1 Tax=Tumidithrix helvetica TaxID=3457545 RepID=UPI003CA9D8AA